MKKTRKSLACILVLTIATMLLAACSSGTGKNSGQEAPAEKKTLKIACVSTIEPIVGWLKEGLTPMGYEVEIVMFDANQLPATALKDGSVDGLITNHQPWIKTFNKENNANLQMLEPYMYYARTAVYSTKHNTLEELPQNAKIAVPGDPSNMDRSLNTLKSMGLITLGEKKGNFYTILDIKDNPKNIKIIETEITQTIRSINDVDAVITMANRVRLAGYDPNKFLYDDATNKDFPIGLVVNPKDINTQWAKDALKVTQSDEFRAKFNKHFNGTYILYDKK